MNKLKPKKFDSLDGIKFLERLMKFENLAQENVEKSE